MNAKYVAIVGLGAILPDSPDVSTFWQNVQRKFYAIREVPPDRWRADLFYDPDPNAPDKTYSKIGAWVRAYEFEPLKWGIPIPPRTLEQMDEAQKWAIAASRQALLDYGYPERRALDPERVGVIFGNALGGEYHYRSTMRIYLPAYLDSLQSLPAFRNLPAEVQRELLEGMQERIWAAIPPVTEDTMPGELANILAGRVANVFNFGGPSFVTDAACASSMAALQAAVEALYSYQCDAVLAGGVDRNMGVEGFVKFSKIGALSPDGSRPYAEGANGFVMGEGAAVFLLKRLADAERDGDRIYAVIRAIGASSDGKGKGITAPNQAGQERAIRRAWEAANVSPATVGLIEGHGTSTRVGDVVEVAALHSIFGQFGLKPGTIALGSVKSNIGHLKSAAGAASVLKVALALYHKVLPPSVNFTRPNPQIDFAHIPFYVNCENQPWEVQDGEVRRAGVSAFGFGGTNFHMVMEEHIPGLLTGERKIFPGAEVRQATAVPAAAPATAPVAAASVTVTPSASRRGRLFLAADSVEALREQLQQALAQARQGILPPTASPTLTDLRKAERLAIEYGDAEELLKRGQRALQAFDSGLPNGWQALTAQGIYRGHGPAGKLAFLFPGQGSQYANMLRELRQIEPVVAETFREADAVMTPIIGRPLSECIFTARDDEASIAAAERTLKDTAITQPAVLTANVALLRLLAQHGYAPDMVAGHSLGEYGALVAAGVLTFAEALEVVSARGREMTRVSLADNGCMAAISAPIEEVERILNNIPGYVIIANLNSPLQSVIAGETRAVEAAIEAFLAEGYQAVKIPVSHAFHSRIVSPASIPLRQIIARMNVQPPRIPIIANVTGEPYPAEREQILDMLALQLASPVQFIKSVETMYALGARVFVEVGPKRVLTSLVNDILKGKEEVSVLATNHPRKGSLVSFSEALCGLYASGAEPRAAASPLPDVRAAHTPAPAATPRPVTPGWQPLTGSVVISGAGLGLPGRGRRVFDDGNVQALLSGEIRIDPLPLETRRSMLKKRITRLVKSEAGAIMQTIEDLEQTLKLAGQRGDFDLINDFGIPEERVETFDISTQLAVAAGIEALRDAGIPLVMDYRRTTTGSYLPNRWMLPEALRDETGVVFASAFPGLDRMAEEASRYYTYDNLVRQRAMLQELLALAPEGNLRAAIEQRLLTLEAEIAALDYRFDRRLIFRVLPMGHAQFAEYIGARGPNTHVNAACASTTHALAIAEDWIRSGRCRRVVVVSGDDVTTGPLSGWIPTALLATGAATAEGNLRLAALPFDRRRNGMIPGMGAAALVVESQDAVRERGMMPICEILATQIANSAFHGTRLDVEHVSEVMERLLEQAEQRFGIARADIAAQTVFVSHETYTPARGGSASAEIRALRRVFGEKASQVVIANTKGYTGHAMGVGIEDVLAVKALQYSTVPPIANYDDQFEPDPELGDLNLARGGKYNVQYALRLGAGFGSHVAMTLLRKVAQVEERVDPPRYQHWLAAVSGYESPQLEIVQRTLRVRHEGAPQKPPAKSNWRFGQPPLEWATSQPQPASTPAMRGETPQPRAEAQRVAAPATSAAAASAVSASTVPAAPGGGSAPVAADYESIKAYVLGLVSEKTGYPVEMLDLGLDLEADLGIDTVKQAELFAEMRAHYNVPRREDLRLADYNTLEKVIRFFAEAVSGSTASVSAAVAPEAAATSAVSASTTSAAPGSAGVIKRRVPVPVLRPRLDLCQPTGVTLEAGQRVLVIGDGGKVASALMRRLKSRKVEVLLLTPSDLPQAAEKIAAWREAGAIQGVYHLAALDVEPPLAEMTPELWQQAVESRLYGLYHVLRALPEEVFLVSATRCGGLFGYQPEGATAPLGGLVSGFTKAIAMERPQAFVKVVDFAPEAPASQVASRLVDETLFDPVVTEVGWLGEQRYTIVNRPTPLGETANLNLDSTSVFLVSGGSGGITGRVVLDLARQTQGRFYLVGIEPAPDPQDADLQSLRRDREAFRRELMARLMAQGEKVTPVQLEGRLVAMERMAALLDVMEKIRALGAQVTYLTADVTRAEDVERVVEAVLQAEGRVDVLVHAAGIERSRKLEQKPFDEFRLTVAIKADGFFHIFKALEARQQWPRAMVFFASIAGRFGNTGQTDYSAANDFLDRLASAMRRQYPHIKTVALDWGPWGEVGMAARGSIPELMRRAGVEMMPPEEAAPMVYRELVYAPAGEAVLCGALGMMEKTWPADGGLDLEKANAALTEGNPPHVMLSRVSGLDLHAGVILEAELDPTVEPFLRDHALDGTPLLPGVMGIEGFSAAAQHIATTLAAQKGALRVARLEDVQFLTPFKFYRNQPRRLTWKAQVVREAAGLVAYVTLESSLTRLGGAVDHQRHFAGKVWLMPETEQRQAPQSQPPQIDETAAVNADHIYRLYFHGPAFQVLESVAPANGHVVGRLRAERPPILATEQPLLTAPVLLELCLQTAGIWEAGKTGVLALPRAIERVTFYEVQPNGEAVYAEVRPVQDAEGLRFDARVVDASGRVYLELEGYRTSPLPYSVGEELLQPLRILVKGGHGVREDTAERAL